MILKNREKSRELLMIESLNNRMKLSGKDKTHFYNLRKGFEGEVLFDRYIVEFVKCDCLVINDLLLQVNQTTFQIDSLMIISDCLIVFEVKNFEGDHYYEAESDKLYTRSRDVEIVNPLGQLMRAETLLRKLLQNNGFTLPIKSTIVFVNPAFTLYQAPMNKPFVFPTQITQLLTQLDSKPSRMTNKHKILADKLLSLDLLDSPFKQIPEYEYDHLKKGITCAVCSSFSLVVEGQSCVCLSCDHKESVTSAVLRSVGEFRLLFPERKVTTMAIYDWCGGVVESRKRIQRILDTNLKMVGKFRWASFE